MDISISLYITNDLSLKLIELINNNYNFRIFPLSVECLFVVEKYQLRFNQSSKLVFTTPKGLIFG